MSRHTVLHLLHDAGAAAWFGGSLMGATSLNAAAAQLADPAQRAKASTAGWSRWAPVGAAAAAAHTIGAIGLTRTDAHRIATQKGVARTSAIKTVVTGAGLGVAGYSVVLNRKMAAHGALSGQIPVEGATEPSAGTPEQIASTQQQLKIVQWANPLLAGALVGLGSYMSQQQRPGQVIPGMIRGVGSRVPTVALAPAAAAVLAGTALRSRRRKRKAAEQQSVLVVETATPVAAEPVRI